MESKPILVDNENCINVRYQNLLLYPTINPLQSVLRRVSRLEVIDKTLIFIPSPVLGYGIRELLNKLPPESHILCVEVDQPLMKLFQENAATAILSDPRFTAIRTENIPALLRTVESLELSKFRRIQPLYLSKGYHLHKDIYDEMRDGLESRLRLYWQNKMTLIRMASLWMRNFFDNLALMPYLNCLSILHTDAPVLVTGAGPSLEESLSLIRKIRDKVVLCAVDTSLPVLYQESLIPDFVFVLESQLANVQDFTPCASIDSRLICDLTTHPTILRKFRDKLYLYSSRFHPLSIFSRLSKYSILPAVFPPLGSVGVAAVYAALSMTTGPVFMTGLDFSYPRGETHARGTPFHIHMLLSSNRKNPLGNTSYQLLQKRPLLWKTDKYGRRLLSDLILISYAQGLRDLIKEFDRVYYIGKPGIPAGACQISSNAQLTSLLSTSHPVVKESYQSEFQIKDVVAFIENEKHLLKRSHTMISSTLHNQSQKERPLTQSERNILEDVAYIYLAFPDQNPVQNFERSFFKRSLVSTTYFLSRLERTEQLLSSRP